MQCTIINNTPSAKLSIKNTFYEVTSEEEDSSCEGLRRVSSCPSLCATLSVESGGDGSSSEHSRSVPMSWANLSDEDELSDWQSSSGLANEIGYSPTAEEKQHRPPGEAARTRLRSAASLFVPFSSTAAADTCCKTPGHLEASAPGIPPASAALRAGFTTVMMRNLPCGLSRKSLLRIMNRLGFQGLYDFFYLPMDQHHRSNVGYAFVNFRTPEACARFAAEYHGFNSREKLPGYNSKKICEVSAARFQGCDENIRRLQASSVMAELMATPDWLPMLFDEAGEAVEFPLPDASKEVIQASRSSRGRLERRKGASTM